MNEFITLTGITSAAADAAFHLEEQNGVLVCTVSAHAGSAKLDPDSAVRLTITPAEPVCAYMANVLYSPHWCRPEFGKDFRTVPDKTQALLWRTESGKYCFILPLASGSYVTALKSADGSLCADCFSNVDFLSDCETTAFVAAQGGEPYALMEKCAKEAAHILGGLRVRSERRYPELFEYLGWCSWDAMEIWVNETEILEKCEEFRKKDIPVRWAILDDMWADVQWTQKLPKFTPHSTSFGVMHSSTLNDYEADPERFPNGLAGCIERMKKEYGMKVGIWHPTSGYWSGLTPDSKVAREMQDVTVTVPEGRIMPDLGDPAHAFLYFSRMHAFFRDCGADFMKIDNQCFIRRWYRNVTPVTDAAKNLHTGIEASVGMIFDNNLINCMCMASENMFSRPTTAIARCSNDFQPENRAWFAKHIMQCAYNGLVQGQYYYNDWDMWWSDDEQATKNSVLRALSGGPIYVSDRLERSRAEIFRPLCFSDGRILRADNVAVPTPDCLLADMTAELHPLKVFNRVGKAAYIAAFNLHAEADHVAVAGSLSPAEIPGLEGDTFLLYEYFTGTWKLISQSASEPITLPDADTFRLYSLIPVENGTAVVGDTTKFLSVRAVSDSANGFVRMIEGGTLKIYSAAPITYAKDRAGNALPLTKDGDLYTVTVTGRDCEIYFG